MGSVYILFTEGEFGDEIHGVFSDRAKAESVLTELPPHEYTTIKEYLIDEAVGFRFGPIWMVTLDLWSGNEIGGSSRPAIRWIRHPEQPDISFRDTYSGPAIIVKSPTSLEHAQKVAHQQRLQWLIQQA